MIDSDNFSGESRGKSWKAEASRSPQTSLSECHNWRAFRTALLTDWWELGVRALGDAQPVIVTEEAMPTYEEGESGFWTDEEECNCV